MIKYWFLLSILTCILPRESLATVTGPIELYAVHYPPYQIIDNSGEISGIDVEVTRAAFEAVNIPIIVKTAPWKRILKNIQYGRIAGTITCSKRPGREVFMGYSAPISSAQQVAFSAVSTVVYGLKQFSDLENYNVTVVEGWGIQKELELADIPHIPTTDVASGINSIVYRDVDVFYNGYLTTMYQARKMGLETMIKATFLEGQQETDFHVCFSKAYPGYQRIKQRFNKGLEIIKQNGVYGKIHQRYENLVLSLRK